MKPHTIFYLVILLASIIHLQSSCDKSNSEPKPKELPPITTEGLNTLGFLLNGEVWLPGGGGIGHSDKDFVMDTFSDLFRTNVYFQSRSEPDNRQDLNLRIEWLNKNCLDEGPVIYRQDDFIIFIDFKLNSLCSHFYHLRDYSISLIFCDMQEQIISGTFELEFENECGDIYEITEGRFDARFRYF